MGVKKGHGMPALSDKKSRRHNGPRPFFNFFYLKLKTENRLYFLDRCTGKASK